jgi:hypothetical protein
VNVLLMTGCNQWEGGMDVVVEGLAVRTTDQSTLERLAEAWSHKWDGSWNYEPGPEGFKTDENESVLVFTVWPSKVLVFAKADSVRHDTRSEIATGGRDGSDATTDEHLRRQ